MWSSFLILRLLRRGLLGILIALRHRVFASLANLSLLLALAFVGGVQRDASSGCSCSRIRALTHFLQLLTLFRLFRCLRNGSLILVENNGNLSIFIGCRRAGRRRLRGGACW